MKARILLQVKNIKSLRKAGPRNAPLRGLVRAAGGGEEKKRGRAVLRLFDVFGGEKCITDAQAPGLR